jgi:1-deoxy-D-xylulose-5-phosphate synthase
VALHRLGVTFVLDRAGVTGNDGASHNGMWDQSILQVVPGLQLTAPRDATRLRQALAHAVTVNDAPTVIRYSKEPVPADIDAIDCIDGIDVLSRSGQDQVLVVGYGAMVPTALTVGRRLADQGIGVTVIDPVWSLPVNPALLDLAVHHQLVITIEDSGVIGGCGARLIQELSQRKINTPVRTYGVPQQFLEHGSRSGLLEELGLSAQEIARATLEEIVGHARPLIAEDVLADEPGHN